MINVTKTCLPELEIFTAILKRAWDKNWITNHGELVEELEQKLKEYLQVDNLLFCSNGTIALQMAIKALNITKEVITTPFSYVATTNAILWENCTPVFVDIEPSTFCIDASKLEAAVTENTEAILATHVYGLPCNVEKIQKLALKHNLKVIYDGAHAFGCVYKDKSLLDNGDITTCSFHATKIFHTGEGGCIISSNKELDQKLKLYRSFGHIGDEYYSIGINGKNSELHAAMGLALLPLVPQMINSRKEVFELYNSLLPSLLVKPKYQMPDFEYNYSYYQVLFDNEEILLRTKTELEQNQINTRRYFFPSLNMLSHITGVIKSCPLSEELSRRVLCLPLYPGLLTTEIEEITSIIRKSVA